MYLVQGSVCDWKFHHVGGFIIALWLIAVFIAAFFIVLVF